MRRWRRLGSAAVVLAVSAAACSGGGSDEASSDEIVIGVPEPETTTSTKGPRIIPVPEALPADLFVDGGASTAARPEPGAGRHLAVADGTPWPAPIAFTSATEVPSDLVFVLVAGSDARPNENLLKTRADSIHLVAVNPATGQGTILGLPRDAWVEIPGRGRGKINNALALGGPDLLAATVRRTTGLPVDYYVVTGFTGLVKMVDELGGVDVMVDRRMSDKASGAFLERGWHRFTGTEALAYSRNRNDVANGDFSRSEHHGTLILSALAKMRGEVADDEGMARWIGVLLRHVRLDIPVTQLPGLAALARNLDPARLTNVVAPGKVGMASRQSVVYLTKGALALFDDIRADGVVGGATASAPLAVASTSSATTGPTTPATAASPATTPPPDPDPAETQEPAEDTTTTTAAPDPSPLPLPRRTPAPGATTTTTGPDPAGSGSDEVDGSTTTSTDPRPDPEAESTTTTTAGEESSEATTTTTGPDGAAPPADEDGGSGGGGTGSRRGRRG